MGRSSVLRFWDTKRSSAGDAVARVEVALAQLLAAAREARELPDRRRQSFALVDARAGGSAPDGRADAFVHGAAPVDAIDLGVGRGWHRPHQRRLGLGVSRKSLCRRAGKPLQTIRASTPGPPPCASSSPYQLRRSQRQCNQNRPRAPCAAQKREPGPARNAAWPLVERAPQTARPFCGKIRCWASRSAARDSALRSSSCGRARWRCDRRRASAPAASSRS